MKSTTGQIKAWSFSRYNDYTTCPRKAYYKHVLKMKEAESPQMLRGTDIHSKAEKYAKSELARIPKELSLVATTLKLLREMYKKNRGQVILEDSWGFAKNWDSCKWDDWNNCYLRIKLDFAYAEGTTLNIGDWKTGKFSEYKNSEYVMQQELYALAGLLKFPRAEKVVPKLYYTDAGVVYPRPEKDPEFVFTRKDQPKLIKLWEKRIKPMMSDTSFKEKPSDFGCKYCSFSKAKGGPCKY